MLGFFARNKEAAAMVSLLGVAAVVVIILASRKHCSYGLEVQECWETEDISSKPHVFSTRRLPADDRFMPSIGNGHLATNVFSDTVYMDGLYNGNKGYSHRARIPAYANVRLNSTLKSRLRHGVFSLDTKDAAFKVLVNTTRSIIKQRIYAHRFYTRTIVNQIKVERKHLPAADPDLAMMRSEIWIPVCLQPGKQSEDISFENPVSETIEDRQVWSTWGQTRVSEDFFYQPEPSEVFLYWTAVPDRLIVHQQKKVFTFVMVADKDRVVARKEIIKVLQEDGEDLYKKHVAQWHKLHQGSGMYLQGDLQLSKIVNGIWYYFLSSLPSEESYQPAGRFYGLSPTGLARGGTFVDYEGHNFWDTEIWMFPSILLLHPRSARQLLQYRVDTAYVAEEIAKLTGHKGYRFPWESGYTGVEVTQPCCPEVAEFEQHISGCISFAARQYMAVTRDDDWLQQGGCDLVTRIADFWASRAIVNFGTGLFDIPNVMGPDEDHSNVTNSAFTNVVAGYSLYLAQYASCICKKYYRSRTSDGWAGIAWSLALPYDAKLDYHPQFENYTRGERIKQADAVLLGYPLLYPMNKTTRKNDLSYYEFVTRDNGPAMTWSMHAISHLQLDDTLRASSIFNKTYAGYVREPFKVWSELQRPRVGAVNFLTGMGGFLQTLLFGYGGISIHLDRLVIRSPQLPPRTNRLKIKGIKYLGAVLNLDIKVNSTNLKVISVDHNWPLTLDDGYYNTTLIPNSTLTFIGKGPFTIKTAPWKNCEVPADTIGQDFHLHNAKDMWMTAL